MTLDKCDICVEEENKRPGKAIYKCAWGCGATYCVRHEKEAGGECMICFPHLTKIK